MKKMGGGTAGNPFMQFGKSNAKVYVESTTGITFNDVAGEDEAKELLTEEEPNFNPLFDPKCNWALRHLEYFPVAEASNRTDMTVSFVNSWMFDRDYGGSRQHEGTDIMPSVDERGLYPVVSMTDGTVRSMGWLELGGWRIGIDAPGGAYFYYAHLASYADLKEGDRVEAQF